MASFSLTKAVGRILSSPKRGNASECDVFTAIFADTHHPSLLGKLLLTDALVLYLAKARAYHHNKLQQQGGSGAAGQGLLGAGGMRQCQPRGFAPAHPDSVMVPQV